MKTEASYHQERLWFIDRFEAGYLYESNPVYHNVPLILEIKGTVDLSLLERCIRDIAARHEVLRTRIETKDNRPVQVIETEPAVELEDMEAVWGFVNRPMRLDERLMRVGVQQLAEGRYLLCVVFHHAICDRYSLELFTGELLTVYGAYVEGREPGLPEPGFQYGDFSQWQRELPEDTLESFLFYWKGKLRDGVEPLELPTDSQRLAVHVFHAARRDFGITPGVTEKAKNLARRRGVDVGVVLMAAFKVLLHKYTGQQEIVIGTAAANREMEGLERVMGPVANLLVLPGTVKPGSNFLEILSVLGRDMDEVYRYGAMPFDRLAVELNPRKDMSRTVFFDVVFEYGEAVPEIPAIKGIESVKVVETNLGWGKYDLNLWVRDEKNGFSAVLVYNGDYYKESTITRLTDHYQRLLERLVSEPHQRVSDISALSDEEKRQLVVDLNDTAADYPKDKTIHQLFEEQAAKTPDRIAVTYRSYRTHMTYSRLNRASDHLAAILQKKGVMPDTIVGIKMERSLEMIIGILGILKAGGAYMPIDPDYPEERIDFMLKDSGATLDLTLTHPPPAGHPRRGPSNALSRGDLKDWEHLGKSPLERGARRVGCVESAPCPANLAYVIYTSGTTGKPKGSLITHRNVVRLMKNDRFQFDFNERDVWTLFHSFCFDFSVWEMYGALLYGGSVVVVPRMTARSTGDFLELLHSSGVTVLCQTPPAFYNLAREELSRGDAASLALRYVIFGGDMLHPPRLKEWREKYPATRLINMYGITETTVHVTFKEITETEIAQPTSNIGRPIPTLAAYVVDPHDELVPIGVPGELLVGGDGVCRGYLNRPELTNQKFFGGSRGAAFQKSPPGKMYRTGDKVRLLDTGELEYLGRIDHQVKIRGFRIELGEIQHRLLEFFYIKECVVVDRTDASGDKFLCAYVVCGKERNLDTRELREHLTRKLPDYMVPAHFVRLDAIPLTSNGKTDRKALPDPEISAGAEYTPPGNEIEKKTAGIWAEVLNVGVDVIGRDTNFFEIGGNSLKINRVIAGVLQEMNIDIPVVTLFEYPTVSALSQHLAQLGGGVPAEAAVRETHGERPVGGDIAVIGMAGRFSGANSIEEFWENLIKGKESISRFSREELLEAGMDEETVTDPDYVPAWGMLPGKEDFDASFFQYTPGDADLLDPQMRVFHQCCWQALEHAGYYPGGYGGDIGLYAGGGHNFAWEMSCRVTGKNDTVGDWAADKLNNIDYLSTRIAYNFNLRGPAVTVQTACSTSLTAIHTACRALVNGECHMALAGGVEFSMFTAAGYLYQEGMVLSPDGRCRAFDAEAGGTVPGEGAAVVVLKPLSNALADGDFIHAVVKGSAINNDGKAKVGFTAPGVNGQKAVILSALAAAGVEPSSIGYIETHGTGTSLGDPIEIEALKKAFATDKRHFCALGSVKSNVGHTGSAAGVTGFIKTVLALEHGLIPASLHYKSPNPGIDFENSPFYVNRELKEWKRDKHPLRAGVSSFGIGGTNAHVILEDVRAALCGRPALRGRPQLLVLSAKTPTALDKMTENLHNFLGNNLFNPDSCIYTLQVGREPFKYKRMAICSDAAEMRDAEFSDGVSETRNRPVVFMFPGQGSQYADMGKGLYEREPVFREETDRCFEIMEGRNNLTHPTLRAPLSRGDLQWESAGDTGTITQTEIAQPLIFIFEYALAKLLMSWGFKPYAMMGHSIGEYAAAHLSGVMSLEDALTLVTLRGKLMQSVPGGSMLSVPLSEETLKSFLKGHPRLTVAAVNTSNRCVVSGPDDAVDSLVRQLDAEGMESRRLHTSHAFHSAMMDPILGAFEAEARKIRLNEPQIPYISNVTGGWITSEAAADPGYWSRHIRNTVRFADGLTELFKIEDAVLLEVGPGNALSTFARQHAGTKADRSIVNLVRHPKEKQPDDRYLMTRIGKMWLEGMAVDWQKLHGPHPPHRVPMPTYPFEAQPFPLGTVPGVEKKQSFPVTPLTKKKNMADWFYVPTWKRVPQKASREDTRRHANKWLIFACPQNACPQNVQNELTGWLKQAGQDVVTVETGTHFSKESRDRFLIDPRNDEDYEKLFNHLAADERLPGHIVHMWGLHRPGEDWLDTGFHSLINIAKAIGKQGITTPMHLDVVTTGMFDITGSETPDPINALVMGPVTVIPVEYPNIHCRCIDLQSDRLPDALVTELVTITSEPVAAFRGKHRWVRRFEPFPLELAETFPLLKEGGVYLVTGGLGGIGLELARYLAEDFKARLVLIDLIPFPAKEEWETFPCLSPFPLNDDTAVKIRMLREMENAGARVLVFNADVSDPDRMREVLAETERQMGTIHGIIHTAGAADGRVIPLRTRRDSEKILVPKVNGTLVLDALLNERATKPDFFLLCSSLDSYLPEAGQVAYTAANNFLDAYTAAADSAEMRVIAVNWEAWLEVGMAAAAGMAAAEGGDYKMKRVFISRLNPQRDWVLGEHRVSGKAVLPGTVYLEMAAAAVERHTGATAVEITDFQLLSPLTAPGDGEVEVKTVLLPLEESFELSILSREFSPSAVTTPWQKHAECTVIPLSSPPLETRNLDEIRQQCAVEPIVLTDAAKSQGGAISVGPRWDNFREGTRGPDRGIARLRLPEEFLPDTAGHRLHPALLDVATSFLNDALKDSSDTGTWLPAFIRKVRVTGPLPAEVYCFARRAGDFAGVREFDIIVLNAQGHLLADIEGFTLLEVSQRPPAAVSKEPDTGSLIMRNALESHQGVEVFKRVLMQTQPQPQVLVSTVDFPLRLERHVGSFVSDAPTRQAAAPIKEGTTPQILAAIWQQLLGIETVGLHDDFFELGGDSLKALTIIGRIHKELNVKIGLAEFFSTPTIAGLADAVGGTSESIYAAIEPAKKFLHYPLSSAQKRLYFLQQLQPESVAYNLPEIIMMHGEPDVPRFERALQDLVQRHESLRTSFQITDGQPAQVIHEEVEFNLDFYEESPGNIAGRGGAAVKPGASPLEEHAALIARFVRPFDLTRAPLLRTAMVHLEKKFYLWFWDVHHIAADATGLAVLKKDLLKLYHGEPPAPLRIQYKDFSQWQNRLIEDGGFKEQEEYWLNELSGPLPPGSLAADFPRPAVAVFEGDRCYFTTAKETAAAFDAVGAAGGTTLFINLLTALNVLLFKYGGHNDIIIGGAVAGRPHDDLQQVAGMFVNILPIRSFPGEETTYAQLLEEVKQKTLRAFDNQDMPFDMLVDKLQLGRQSSGNPLFQLCLNVVNYEEPAFNVEGLRCEAYAYETRTTTFDMLLWAERKEDGFHFMLSYSTELFKPAAAERFGKRLREIIEQVGADKNIKLKDIVLSHEILTLESNVFNGDGGEFDF